VWTSASRQRVRVSDEGSGFLHTGPFAQVSRLGNPLFNEVIVPLGKKDYWNRQPPVHDKQFATYVAHPELASLLPVLYPGAFPNLAALDKAGAARADLGSDPAHRYPFRPDQGLHELHRRGAGRHAAAQHVDPPTPASSSTFSTLGLVGGDPAGFRTGAG